MTLTSNEDDLDFEILGIESNVDDKITYTYARSGNTTGGWEVTINKNPKLPTLSTYGSLFVRTNSELSPERTLQVQIVTKGAITVQPSTLNFGRLKFDMDGYDAKPVTKSVTVLKSKGVFAIRDIEIGSSLFTAEITEMVPGKRYKIDITFDPPTKKKPKQSEIHDMIIHTNDPSEPAIRVKLVARAL